MLNTWRITVADPTASNGHRVAEVNAQYPTGDAVLPGWTLFKDANHKIVYMVRSDQAIDVQRIDPAAA